MTQKKKIKKNPSTEPDGLQCFTDKHVIQNFRSNIRLKTCFSIIKNTSTQNQWISRPFSEYEMSVCDIIFHKHVFVCIFKRKHQINVLNKRISKAKNDINQLDGVHYDSDFQAKRRERARAHFC